MFRLALFSYLQMLLTARERQNGGSAALARADGQGVFAAVELVCVSDGLQFGVLVPSVVNARASVI